MENNAPPLQGAEVEATVIFYFVRLCGAASYNRKNTGFGVRPHLAFSFFHLEDQTALLQGLQGLFNENDGKSSDIVNIYYVLTTLSAEHVTSVSI